MPDLKSLIQRNREWSEAVREHDPDFFSRLVDYQTPEYLWVGCSDSRVPANQIVGLGPGEIFVHRNVGNLFVHTDMNALTVLQFAVEFLRVRHIIVCGHYGCGGVRAAMGNEAHGFMDHWLQHIKDVYRFHRRELAAIEDVHRREQRLCELNVIEQVRNIAYTDVTQRAWVAGYELSIHGWIYGTGDGLLKDLGVHVHGLGDVDELYRTQGDAETR